MEIFTLAGFVSGRSFYKSSESRYVKTPKKNKLVCLKRRDIIICPYFRLSYWEYKKNKYAFDMCCALDNAIFFSYSVKHDFITKADLRTIRMNMKENCASECPKLWQYYDQIEDPDDYDQEEELYKLMCNDSGPCPPEFDENFKFGDPPF